MSADHLEIEGKYDVAEGLDLPSLVELPGVTSITGPHDHNLEATYFDTAELSLTAAGITVRRRIGGEDAGWHLKLPTRTGRFEMHQPLSVSTKTVPKAQRLVLQTITRGEALAPIATVRTRRSVLRLVDARGRILADVGDDRVTAQTSMTAQEIAPRAWREWEIELVEGDRNLLAAAAERFADAGATPSDTGSKLRRALAERAPERRPSPRTERGSTAEGVVHTYLFELVDDLRVCDPLVRADAPDAVHKMRVATRRLRSALATFRPLLDREVTDPLRDELKWVAGMLGDARDAEVLRKRLLDQLDEEPELVRGRVRPFVDRDLQARYRRAHAACLESMQTDRYFALLDRLEAMADSPPWATQASRHDRGFVRKRVRHDWKRLAHRVRALEGARNGDDFVTRLHDVRKAAKRVRYAAELLIPLDGKKAKRFVRAVKRLQSVLGDHQDSAAATEELRQLSDRATAQGVNAFTFGVIHARQEQVAALRRSQFQTNWDHASRRRLRKWLS